MKIATIHAIPILIAVCCAMVVLSGCSPRPSAIAPVSFGGAYNGTSCEKARTLYAQELSRRAALYRSQNAAATGDAIGVLLIGIPASNLMGQNSEGEIAAHKGKMLALQSRLEGC